MKAKAYESNGNKPPSSPPSPPPQRRRFLPLSKSRRYALCISLWQRLRYLFMLPLLYVSGLLMCVGPLSALIDLSHLFGAVYRSHEIFDNLWSEIQLDNSSSLQVFSQL